MKRKITVAAYLAGVTTLAVSLPAMAEEAGNVVAEKGITISAHAKAILPRKDQESEV